jgi:hypothetical protein
MWRRLARPKSHGRHRRILGGSNIQPHPDEELALLYQSAHDGVGVDHIFLSIHTFKLGKVDFGVLVRSVAVLRYVFSLQLYAITAASTTIEHDYQCPLWIDSTV